MSPVSHPRVPNGDVSGGDTGGDHLTPRDGEGCSGRATCEELGRAGKGNGSLQSSLLSGDALIGDAPSADGHRGILCPAQVLPINSTKRSLSYSGEQPLFSTPPYGITAEELSKLLSVISLMSINTGQILSRLFYISRCHYIISFHWAY